MSYIEDLIDTYLDLPYEQVKFIDLPADSPLREGGWTRGISILLLSPNIMRLRGKLSELGKALGVGDPDVDTVVYPWHQVVFPCPDDLDPKK